MLQIRLLSKGSPADAGGGVAKSPVETVTVACPDHLILADLPVAKSLGVVTASAPSSVRLSGRRSRRTPGEKVHICVRCDFPIAIYGRLTPCDHVFCLACARSESTCYLCDERIQKIQTIKMMEGIFICAAPHCLRSFLKRSEFELHISVAHADHFVDGGSEGDGINIPRPSSADSHKQSLQPESSTARAPPPQRPGFSGSSNPQLQDREERTRRPQPPPRPPIQLRPENNNLWYQQQGNRRDSEQFPSEKQAPPLPLEPPNYNTLPVSSGQTLAPGPSFSFPPFATTDGSQPYYTSPFETATEQESGSSVLGIPPSPAAGFPDCYPRPWGMMPFVNLQFPPALPEGFGDPPFFQGEQQNPSLQAKESEPQGGGAHRSRWWQGCAGDAPPGQQQ